MPFDSNCIALKRIRDIFWRFSAFKLALLWFCISHYWSLSQDWCFGPVGNGNRITTSLQANVEMYENRAPGSELIDTSYRSANFKHFCPELTLSYSLQQDSPYGKRESQQSDK